MHFQVIISCVADPWDFGTDQNPGIHPSWVMNPDPAIFVSNLIPFWRYTYIIF
jgi:hypothetical protein